MQYSNVVKKFLWLRKKVDMLCSSCKELIPNAVFCWKWGVFRVNFNIPGTLKKRQTPKNLIKKKRASETHENESWEFETSWDIHTVTRNAHQLYDIVSSISARKIHFARPNGDSTFIQTSHSHKMLSSLCQLSWAICSKRSPRSVLAIVQRERLFKWWWRKRCFDFGRFLHVKRVMRARWGVFASPNLITWKSVDWSGSIKGA
jgi:hypothetical protein